MSKNLFLVAAERTECHQSIFEEVTGTESLDIRILKEPNQSRLHPAGKIIVVVETMEQAERLKQYCVNQVQQSNIRIEQLLNQTSPRYEIKYKINIERAIGNVFLSIHDAEKRRVKKGSAVIKTLQTILNVLDETKEDDKKTADIIRNDIQKIHPDKEYTWAQFTGSSYRITYYDSDKSNRVQTSVGNVMIIVSDDAKTKILDAPERKKRIDKKELVFSLCLPLSGFISVYSSKKIEK